VLAGLGVVLAFVVPIAVVVGIALVALAIRRWRRARAAQSP